LQKIIKIFVNSSDKMSKKIEILTIVHMVKGTNIIVVNSLIKISAM